MRKSVSVICFVLICIASVGCVHRLRPEATTIYDGFEDKALGKHWRSDKLAEGAWMVQSDHVRFGQGAAKITIHPHDPSPERSVGETERDELQEADAYNAKENETFNYEFSCFIPNDFPIVSNRLVIAQWKQRHNQARVAVDNPVVALRYVGGELSVTIQTREKKVVHYRTREEIRGRWLDFVFHIRHSRSNEGMVRAWMNNDQILDFHGVTSYSRDMGYPEDSTYYFKMGLYRDDMIEPMTIYLDEFRKSRLIAGDIR